MKKFLGRIAAAPNRSYQLLLTAGVVAALACLATVSFAQKQTESIATTSCMTWRT